MLDIVVGTCSEERHINSNSEASLRYWAGVLRLCTQSNIIYPADEGRDVYAVGSVVIKTGHRLGEAPIDYTYADANEVEAIAIARRVLTDVRVPDIYFADKINGLPVLVQERLPGVSLTVAWPYLSPSQKTSFKAQARGILAQLRTVQAPTDHPRRDHVVPDPGILTNGRVSPTEARILFSADTDGDACFMHNDLTASNLIVWDDRITGLVDWEMAGYFGWRVAAEVHRAVRSPRREGYAQAGVSEEKLRDILWWNDLYVRRGDAVGGILA
ncbi:hypothetical protein E4U42_008082 [Claviceps africana]|uniref:Aminoglycoside phosphotransferase domain-containing protein n=1 Tax=Claviceps africana TaxID=83212 RepID=A0A8K0NNE6_9HYPO|nr:hypothetical protein E4U42_008082 [Claviceps africana]